MSFTREKLRLVTADIMAALKDVEARHGIKITQDRGGFDNGSTGDLKLKFALVNTANGTAELDANTKWALKQYGLTDELVHWPGKVGRWRISGYNSRAHRYPFSITPEFPHQGRGWRVPLSTVQAYFKVRTPVAPAASSAPAPVTAPTTPARTYESQF